MAETNDIRVFHGLPWIISEAVGDCDPSAVCPLLLSSRQILFMCKYTVPFSVNSNTVATPWKAADGISVLYFKHIFGLWKEQFLKALEVYMSTFVSLFNYRKEVVGKAGDIAWESVTVPLNQTLTRPAQNIGLRRQVLPHTDIESI